MLEAILRSHYQKQFIDPVSQFFSKKLSANHITTVGFLLGVSVAPALAFHHPLIATLLLTLSGYCDTLDGTIARITHTTSHLGTVFDIISDRAVEFSVILGLFCIDPQHRGFLSMMMLGSVLLCVTSFLIVGIFTPNQSEKSFHYSPGLMERAEAFIFFMMMIWLPTYFTFLASLFSALVFFTAYRRIYQFVKYHEESA